MDEKSTSIKEYHFDHYADKYESILKKHLSFFEQESDYFAEYKVDCLSRNAIKSNYRKILEYGCGIGRNLKFLNEKFPDAVLFGCDLSEKSLEIAARNNPRVSFFFPAENGPSDEFDLIFVSCVFHHIPPDLRELVLRGLYRMISDDGEIFIFEHNPYNPVTIYIVKKCSLDSDAVLIKLKSMKSLLEMSRFKIIKNNYTLFFPSVLKKLRPIEKFMHSIPLGGQYFIQAKK